MSNWGHVEKITKEIGGKTYTFKSLLEMRWAVWCQLRKEQGIIVDWWYEIDEIKVETKLGEIKIYRPDFTIAKLCPTCKGNKKIEVCDTCWPDGRGGRQIMQQIDTYPKLLRCFNCGKGKPKAISCPDCDKGTVYSYEETKGWFMSKDYTRMKLMSEQYENPLTLIFANLSPNAKSHKAQYGRAKRLEKLLESNGGRVIYDANKTIFKPIRYLFEN